MKKVTKFESEDGRLFDSEKKCKEHEFKILMQNRIYDELRNADAEEIYNWIIEKTKGFKHDA